MTSISKLVNRVYRSFLGASEDCDEKGIEFGPTVAQFAGALMGVPDLNEEHMPTAWKQFAAQNEAHALLLRRSVAEMRLPDRSRFTVDLQPGVARMKKWLVINILIVDRVVNKARLDSCPGHRMEVA
jgi:hypothetical protein